MDTVPNNTIQFWVKNEKKKKKKKKKIKKKCLDKGDSTGTLLTEKSF